MFPAFMEPQTSHTFLNTLWGTVQAALKLLLTYFPKMGPNNFVS